MNCGSSATARPADFAFGSRKIGPSAPVFIIAEIGINHEGDEETCARLIRSSADAGADAIKLQTVDPDENYAPGTESHALFSRAVLSKEATARMFALGRELGMEVFTTAGDRATIDWVETLDPAGYKISSGLLTTTPLVQHAARTGRPMLLSTGMATLSDIERAVSITIEAGCAAVGLLQCTSIYPAPIEALNLAAIRELGHLFQVPVGFSDHSLGIEAAPVAVGAGAVILEKHITFDTGRPAFDHGLSVLPDAFKEMVEAVRRVELMLGDPAKGPTPQERRNAERYHRSLAARRDLDAGHALCDDDIGFMRLQPGANGLNPDRYWDVLGRRLKRPVARHHAITEDNLEQV